MDLLLAIDLGTSYFKFALFDRDGTTRGLGRVALVKDPSPNSHGRCELPIGRFWQALQAGLDQALAAAGATAGDIRAVSYASQANSFVLLDEHDQPLTPLLLWPDRRAEDDMDAVAALWRREDFTATTGIGIDASPEFAPAKLLWMRREQPALWAKVRRVATISDYLVLALTGLFQGDSSTAALTGLWNVAGDCWWGDAMKVLDLPRELFCSPRRPGTAIGCVMPSARGRLSLPLGAVVAAGSLDHYAASLGAGIGVLAPCSESTGTVLACISHHREFRPVSGTCIGPAAVEGYYNLAFADNGASALEWYQRTYTPQLSIEDLLAQAATVNDDADGLVALPCVNRYPDLEGFQRRTSSHGHGHFVRAILASTVRSLASLVDQQWPFSRPESIVATGGGAASDLWLQMKADLLGVTMIRSACREPACLGAAMMAAAAAGWYDSPAMACSDWAQAARRFEPRGKT